MEAEHWRLLEWSTNEPSMNLSLEEAVAREVGAERSPNTIWFWTNRNAAVIGYFQAAAFEVDLDACSQLGIPVLRRFTGGGAVYHDLGTLNYSIAKRADREPLQQSSELFTLSNEALLLTLRKIGLKPKGIQPNGVEVDGRKVAGAAGAVKWKTSFLHGSILIQTDLKSLYKVLAPSWRKVETVFVRSNPRRVINLSEMVNSPLSIDHVKQQLCDTFGTVFAVDLRVGGPTERERLLAERLNRDKYSCDAWNLRT